MVQPQPYKYKCDKCSFTKVIKPKSDVIQITEILVKCPNCGGKLHKVPLNLLDKLFR